MSKSNPSVTVCCDPGTSLLKVLYQVASEPVKYLTMDSEVIALPPASASSLPVDSGFGKPEDNAWVRWKETGDCYAIGQVAKGYRATVSMKRLKYESIVPKILAVLGAIARKENLNDGFDLALAVLVPISEYPNREQIETELRQKLEQFYFQQQPLTVHLQNYTCVAEASGLVFQSIQQQGIEKFRSLNLAYLMFGYRNTSLLLFRKGTLSQSESQTTQLGFYELIDKITAKTSGVSREEVQAAIVTDTEDYYNPQKACLDVQQITKIAVEDLIRSTDPTKAKQEKLQIATAIETATQEYWQVMANWLHEALPPLRQLDGVIYSGGAATFLSPQVEAYFNSHIPNLVQMQVEDQHLLRELGLTETEQKHFEMNNLSLRFSDVWGLFVKITNYHTQIAEKAA